MRRLSAIAAIASCFVALAIAAPASAGTLDQQQTSSNTNAGLFSTQSGAQTFTAGLSGVLDQADLNLLKVGTPPASVTVEIRNTDNAGSPRTVLATGTIPTSAIGATGAFLPVTFATPAPVVAGTRYAIVAYSAGSAGDAVGWLVQTTGNPYSSGAEFISNDVVPPGGNWNEFANADFAFKTYVGPTPPTPPTPSTSPTPPTSPTSPSVPSANLTGTCKGLPATIVGTSGSDALSGTPAMDVIAGLGGNDTLSGLAGNDLICGNKGKDTLKGGPGNDFLNGQKGNDKLFGQKGKDILNGKTGKDLCVGGPGNDHGMGCDVEKSILS